MFCFRERRVGVLGSLLVLLLSFSSSLAAEESFMSSNPTGGDFFWQDYLYKAGSKLGCYFTIEVLRDDDIRSPITTGCVIDNQNVSSVKELIGKVSQDVKGIAFVQNSRNPAIFHVIDERLKKTDHYALEEKLSITFSGVLDSFGWELKKHVKTAQSNRTDLVSDDFGDHVTRVVVNATNERLRDILTDCVPLDVYKPILWRATTERSKTASRLGVSYYGPDPDKAIFWKEYVARMTGELDCYLTVEMMPRKAVAGEPFPVSPFDASYLARSPAVKTIGQFAEKLQREMVGVRVTRDVAAPRVIHLVDEPLLKVEGYLMERKVGLDYSGSLGGVIVALEKKHPELGLTSDDGKTVGDKVTRVQIAVENHTVREVLTNAVPLKGYQRVLWKSATSEKGEKHITRVLYSGPDSTLQKGRGIVPEPEPPAKVTGRTDQQGA